MEPGGIFGVGGKPPFISDKVITAREWMMGDLHLPIPPDRVVTEDCYPYQPPQQTPAEVGRCMMQSRSVGRGKRQATQRCPNTQNYHNDIYQSTPPYRLSSNVSERKLHKCTQKRPLSLTKLHWSAMVCLAHLGMSEIVEGQWDVLFFFFLNPLVFHISGGRIQDWGVSFVYKTKL